MQLNDHCIKQRFELKKAFIDFFYYSFLHIINKIAYQLSRNLGNNSKKSKIGIRYND